MFKKLLPILGLLLLVSCEGELTVEQLEDAVNGTGTVTLPPPPPKLITNWLDKADFLANKTCTVTETTLTNDFIKAIDPEGTLVDYMIGQEFKLSNGHGSFNHTSETEYIGFQSDAALNSKVRMFIRADEGGEINDYLTVGTLNSSGNDENLSIRKAIYTLDEAGTIVGTMTWLRVGQVYTLLNQETEKFTITLKCVRD